MNSYTYSYETIIDLSFKMKKSTLNEETVNKLNNIRKLLNIPVVEVIKKTVIQKKQTEIAQITKTKQKEWVERIETLKQQIQYWIDNPNKKTIEIIELFY